MNSLSRRSLFGSECSVACGDEIKALNCCEGSLMRKPLAFWSHEVSWPPMPAGHIRLSDG